MLFTSPTSPTSSPCSPGNMFAAPKLRADLSEVRRRIEAATLIAYGRRTLAPGEAVPDLRALRKLESELIVRIDVATDPAELARYSEVVERVNVLELRTT